MQLDYKDIIIKSYALNMSSAEIARQLGCSKSGVNDFLNAFKKCEALSFPLPGGNHKLWDCWIGLWQSPHIRKSWWEFWTPWLFSSSFPAYHKKEHDTDLSVEPLQEKVWNLWPEILFLSTVLWAVQHVVWWKWGNCPFYTNHCPDNGGGFRRKNLWNDRQADRWSVCNCCVCCSPSLLPDDLCWRNDFYKRTPVDTGQ